MISIIFFLLGHVRPCDQVCPSAWSEGTEKCYKFVPKRLGIKQALEECRKIGGNIFAPDIQEEMDQIAEIARIPEFGLK